MISILYTDGSQDSRPPEKWSEMRPDHVDSIEFKGLELENGSIYWLRHGPHGWRFGRAGFWVDGTVEEWQLRNDAWENTNAPYVPDLSINEAKLGAWNARR